MKEIEVTYELIDEIDLAKDKLSKFEKVGEEQILDTYFYDPNKKSSMPHRNNMGECLRIRSVNKEFTVSYKIDKFDEEGKWLNSDNYETKIENIEDTLNNFNNSNLKELVSLQKQRYSYKDGNYILYLEDVLNLGTFFEIEYTGEINKEIKVIKEEMKDYVETLGLKLAPPISMGKPEMMIKKQNIKLN